MDLHALLRRAADGVCGVNRGGKIALWTPSAEKILGYSAREVLGRPCCDVFVGRDGPDGGPCGQDCHILTFVDQSRPVRHRVVATRTKAGTPVWLDVSIIVVPDARPDTSAIVQLFRDVTTTKEIEDLVRARFLRAQPSDPEGTPPLELTRRELEVLRLIVNGAGTRTIADQLRVSPMTVRNHVQNILRKLNVHSRLEAMVFVTRHRLL